MGYAISPDGHTLVVSRGYKSAEIIDLSQPDRPRRRGSLADSGWRTMADFSADGHYVAGIADSYRVLVWDVASRQVVWQRTFDRQPMCVAFSPDCRQLAVGGATNEFAENLLFVMDVASGTETARSASGNTTARLAWSPDGKLIADVQENGRIYLIPTVGQAASTDEYPIVGSSQLTHCAFSSDGRTLVTGSYDGEVQLWSVPSGKRVAVLHRSPSHITNVGFGSDDQHLWALVDQQPPTLLRWKLR